MDCTVVHVGAFRWWNCLKFGCAVGVAFFNESRVEYFFDDPAAGDPRFFNDLIIFRGVVVVIIIGWFFLWWGRVGVLFGRLLATVLGDHVRKPGTGGFGLFSLRLLRAGCGGDDVAEAAFEFFAELGLRFSKSGGEGFIIRCGAGDEASKTIRCYRVGYNRRF